MTQFITIASGNAVTGMHLDLVSRIKFDYSKKWWNTLVNTKLIHDTSS
jgi:hypothetical protein